jgi:hypothetical protein
MTTVPGSGTYRVREVSDQVIAIPFVLGALMFYFLLYQSRLVPRWLSAWGLGGAALYIMAPLGSMFGLSLGFFMAPLFLQEMAMAIWLIAKGFDSVPLLQRELEPLSPRGGLPAIPARG